MRYHTYLFAVVFSLIAGLSDAAPIVVRSGAHDGFARLVLNVPANTEWSLENLANSARIDIRGHTAGFDTAGVFDRIDRTYVSEVMGNTASLEVEFSCDCILKAFEQGSQMIVLDISNVPEPLNSIKARAGTLQPDIIPLQPLRFGRKITPRSVPDTPQFLLNWDKMQTTATMPLGDSPSTGNAQINNATTTALANAQQQIPEQVGAAATHGLLSPKANTINLPLIQNRPQINAQIFEFSKDEILPNHANSESSGVNIKITSSADILGVPHSAPVSTSLGVQCIDPSVTAIADWASDLPFSTQIAERRNELFSELDRLDQIAAVRLARTYLHFGFGQEVHEILALHPQLAPDNPALVEMADIMDFGYAKQPTYLHHFMECDANVALWAILSHRTIEPTRSINTSAALRAVAALPMHLRAFIAPELSRRLLNYGDQISAAAALRSLERTAHPLSASANLAKADLELAQGDVSAAQDRLAQVVTSNVEQSAEALINFVDSHLQADAKIEQNVATLVEAYALEMRDAPIGAELQRTHIYALGKSGQFNAAFETLDRTRNREGSATDNAVTSTLLDLLTRHGDDIEFLDHVFQQNPVLIQAVDPKTVLKISDRLVDLGFALEAERLLDKRPNLPNDEDARITKAKIALSLSRPFEAEALIFGLKSDKAETLRAQAKMKSGSFVDAHALYSRLGEEDKSQQTAWLSNDWVELVKQETPVLGPIARLANAELFEDSNLDGMLLRTRGAISESADARILIEELLRTSSIESIQEP